METYFIIYRTTCLATNKFYIGMHKTKNLQDGYLGSGLILKRSINKYGKHTHKFEIIEFLPNLDSLIKREREIVKVKSKQNLIVLKVLSIHQKKSHCISCVV